MLKLIGYADRFSVAPGETIRFMVSALEGQAYRAEIVRLIHGDANPEGPGFKSAPVPGPVDGTYPGRRQEIHTGSCVTVPDHEVLHGLESFTVACMIWPTLPGKGRQAILGHWSEPARRGWRARDRRGRRPRRPPRRRIAGQRDRHRRRHASRATGTSPP